MPWNAQVLLRLLHRSSPAEAILAPLWARRPDGATEVEKGFGDQQRAALAASSPTIDVPQWSLPSSLQAVRLTTTPQPLAATADIRSIGGTASL